MLGAQTKILKRDPLRAEEQYLNALKQLSASTYVYPAVEWSVPRHHMAPHSTMIRKYNLLDPKYTLKGRRGLDMDEKKMSWGKYMAFLPLTAGCVSNHFPSAFIFTFVEHFDWMQHSLHDCTQEDRMLLLGAHTESHIYCRILHKNLFNFILFSERPLWHGGSCVECKSLESWQKNRTKKEKKKKKDYRAPFHSPDDLFARTSMNNLRGFKLW